VSGWKIRKKLKKKKKEGETEGKKDKNKGRSLRQKDRIFGKVGKDADGKEDTGAEAREVGRKVMGGGGRSKH